MVDGPAPEMRAVPDPLGPEPVNGQELLERLAALPISEWNYDFDDASIRHLGPMAQDFATAFGMGEDDRHISTSNADGVALAAVQGLNQKVEVLRGAFSLRAQRMWS